MRTIIRTLTRPTRFSKAPPKRHASWFPGFANTRKLEDQIRAQADQIQAQEDQIRTQAQQEKESSWSIVGGVLGGVVGGFATLVSISRGYLICSSCVFA
jgi:hypothetical protein